MIVLNGEEWGPPAEIASELGVRPSCVYDWIRDKLRAQGPTPDVIREGRRVYVRLSAAARCERDSRHVGRPRRAVA